MTLRPDHRRLCPWLSGRWIAADKSTRIPVSMFHAALQIADEETTSEEAECLVANMIFKGFMRGNGINCVRIVPYSAVQFTTYAGVRALSS